MNKNLDHYVKVYNNWLDDDVCDKTISELSNANWNKHEYFNPGDKISGHQNGDRELDVCMYDASTKEHIMQRIWDVYQRYVTELNFTWFSSWSGFSEVRFNKYSQNQIMSKHCDHIHTLFEGERLGVPTMTALGALNDGYEGGEFIMFDNDIIELKKGSIVVFPSNFL